ncbi:Pkinase-domain-containing protein [Anaeromyces robustus]|uniref:Pkinase-domain-containing protein n=1 Tax=Anaeromyces robustus TaxID=1754192 RepID=A0A1Y1WYM1_9FUNG|nr:Pkinase-domain-containing protein [Anaeromyces robustus]|eukprot:ORX78448.1 Pkinase-domain-containing protein [Anaeromyces robustus]
MATTKSTKAKSLFSKEVIIYEDTFKYKKTLGSGTFAVVKLAVKKDDPTEKPYAMKIMDKKVIKGHEKLILREISILHKLDHKNIIKLYDVFETEKNIILQTEFAEGGELFERIVELGYYTENMAKKTIHELLDAINYLHTQDIIHRDLKPENLLLISNESDIDIKVADFGLASFDKNMLLQTSCGTLNYAAPEILNNERYGKPVDLWATGVICYILLSGYPPFGGESDSEIFNSIIHSKFAYFSPEWDVISDNAKDFIKRLLTVDPHKRMTVKEALQHPWIADVNDEFNKKLLVADNIKKNFTAKQKFKATVEAIKAAGRMSILSPTSESPISPTASNNEAQKNNNQLQIKF